MTRLLTAIAVALVATLTLAACRRGNPSSTSSTSSSTFDDADVTFAQSMIPHHQQAVQMARMATTHASSPTVKGAGCPDRGRPRPRDRHDVRLARGLGQGRTVRLRDERHGHGLHARRDERRRPRRDWTPTPVPHSTGCSSP